MTSTNLLSHLQTSETGTPRIPLPTFQSALSHHLSVAPSASTTASDLTVTQLTATVISSPFFHPRSQAFEYTKVQAFEVAFRHAVHLLRQQRSKKDGANYINLSRWTGNVVQGIQGGHPMLRLAACGGILLGVEDLKNSYENGKASIKFSQMLVESEAVVALAEVLDSTTVHTEWEHEFRHQARRPTLLLAFILASHSLPLIDSQRLIALPLYTLARLLTDTLASFFDLSDPNPNSNPMRDLSQVPSLAKLTAVILGALLDSTHARTYTRTLNTVSHTFDTLLHLARTIEHAYNADPSNPIPKQFLLTTLIIAQSVLSSIVYLPPHSTTHPDNGVTPSSLALTTLQSLTHLSLVVSEYGGITKSIEQLQRVFYLSIDVILAPSRQQNQDVKGKSKQTAKHKENVEAYVQHLSHFLQSQSPEIVATHAKLSFALSTFEQLVPVLSPHCIINHVWTVCYPHLANSSESNREIYESAHSVVLSMLVHDSQRRHELNSRIPLDSNDNEEEILWTRFIQRLVPFYAKCLVEDTTLSIIHLRHAISSLVQCATVLSTHPEPTPQPTAVPSTITTPATTAALPWYCVQLILETIDEVSSAPSSESLSPPPLSPLSKPPLSRKDRLHRLHLMLISTLPSLPLGMLELCLERVRGILVVHSKEVVGMKEGGREEDEERKKTLIQTLFELLLSEQMSGEAKEVGVRWWYENLELVRAVVRLEGGEKEVRLQSRL